MDEALNMVLKEMKAGFASVNERFDRLEQKVDSLEQKVDSLEQKVDALEQKQDALDKKQDALAEQMKKGFEDVREDIAVLNNSIDSLAIKVNEHETQEFMLKLVRK